MSRFLERLADGPPVVADGSMGVVLASAVAGLRCPEEANLRAPESVLGVHLSYINAGAELIETNTFGANRGKLARHFLADETEAINAAAVRVAREAREVSGRDVFIAGSIGPLGDVELRGLDPAELVAEQATRARRPRRRPLHGRDVLRPRRARDGARRGALRLVAPDRRAADVRRRRGDARRRHAGGGRSAAAAARLGRVRREPRRRAGRRAHARSRTCKAAATRSRRSRTSASRACPASGSSSRTRRPRTSASSPRGRASSARA